MSCVCSGWNGWVTEQKEISGYGKMYNYSFQNKKNVCVCLWEERRERRRRKNRKKAKKIHQSLKGMSLNSARFYKHKGVGLHGG